MIVVFHNLICFVVTLSSRMFPLAIVPGSRIVPTLETFYH